MFGLLLAFISLLGWGTGDLFGTIASRKIGSISATLWASIFGLCLFSLYIPFALHDLQHYTITLFLLNILIASLSIAGNLAFNEALRIGVPSLVGTISSAFTAVTIVLSVIFFHTIITNIQIGIIVVIFLGIIIASINFKELMTGASKLEKAVLLAIFTMFSWGSYFTLLKLLYPSVGWFWPIYITLWMFPLVILYAKVRKEEIHNPFQKKAFLPVTMSTLLLRSGDFSFNLSVGKGLSAITGPIGGASPILFAILAFIFFKERPNRQQIVGIIITLVGIILLTVDSI